MRLTKKSLFISIVALAMMLMLSVSALSAYIPSKPTGVKATSSSADKVTLTWNKTKGADSYRVYVRQDGKWKTLKNPKTNKCEISGLSASKTYTFAVRSINRSGNKNYICDGYTTVKVKTKALTATRLSASVSADYANLKWKKVPGATGYYVYCKDSSGWNRIGKTRATVLTFYINQLEPETAYQFYVCPVSSADGKTVKGPKSTVVKIKTLRANKVEAKVAAYDENSVTLTWSKAPDASGYKIFRLEDGKWVGVKTVYSRDTRKAVISSLESDSKYTFLVRAFKKTDDGELWFVSGESVVASTDPTVKDARASRTKKLAALLNSKSFTLCYKSETSSYGELPVRIYKNGDSYRLDSRLNEITYVLLNTKKADYVFLPERKLYVKFPFAASGVTDIKSAVDALMPGNDWSARAVLTEFGSWEKVVCEIYTDLLKTKSVRYYYRAGVLVGIEQYNSKGKLVERATVTKISKTASASLFELPQGYKEII